MRCRLRSRKWLGCSGGGEREEEGGEEGALLFSRRCARLQFLFSNTKACLLDSNLP